MMHKGQFYLFISCKKLIGKCRPDNNEVISSDLDFVKYLLESVFVAVISGQAFSSPDHFRLSFAIDRIEEAANRIKNACDALV